MGKGTRIGTFWIRRAINVHVGGWPYRLLMISCQYRWLSPARRAHATGSRTLGEDGWATVRVGNGHPGGRGNRVVKRFLAATAPLEILDSFRYYPALMVRYTE